MYSRSNKGCEPPFKSESLLKLIVVTVYTNNGKREKEREHMTGAQDASISESEERHEVESCTKCSENSNCAIGNPFYSRELRSVKRKYIDYSTNVYTRDSDSKQCY